MTYTVRIQNNKTGEIRSKIYEGEWNDGTDPNAADDHYLWTEGNNGCDCNRAWVFAKIKDPNADDPEQPCGENAFTVLDITLSDGKVISL